MNDKRLATLNNIVKIVILILCSMNTIRPPRKYYN